MSVCSFIASNMPLKEFAPPQEYTLKVDIDKGTVDDGGADDNYRLLVFDGVKDYTNKDYGVYIEWNYTEGRAGQLVEYIRTALDKTDSIELWKVWLTGHCGYEDRPFINRKTISVRELTPGHIREIDSANIWNTPDKRYPGRPSFYCLTITA